MEGKGPAEEHLNTLTVKFKLLPSSSSSPPPPPCCADYHPSVLICTVISRFDWCRLSTSALGYLTYFSLIVCPPLLNVAIHYRSFAFLWFCFMSRVNLAKEILSIDIFFVLTLCTPLCRVWLDITFLTPTPMSS